MNTTNALDEEPEDVLPDEPDEDDLVTTDHRHYYQGGKLVLTVGEDEDAGECLSQHMQREQFFPNIWFISDHGNAHPIGF